MKLEASFCEGILKWNKEFFLRNTNNKEKYFMLKHVHKISWLPTEGCMGEQATLECQPSVLPVSCKPCLSLATKILNNIVYILNLKDPVSFLIQ